MICSSVLCAQPRVVDGDGEKKQIRSQRTGHISLTVFSRKGKFSGSPGLPVDFCFSPDLTLLIPQRFPISFDPSRKLSSSVVNRGRHNRYVYIIGSHKTNGLFRF